MCISQKISWITRILRKHYVENPEQEAEMLLSFVLKKPKEFLYTHGEYKLTFLQILHLKHLIKKRLKGYSLAVTIGKKEFYGYKFKVNKHVLVPRPETEMMTDYVKGKISNSPQDKIVLIDVGTGTACIPISIIKELQKNNLIDSLKKCYAIDISKKTLQIAKKNSKLNHTNGLISFYRGDLLNPVIQKINSSNDKTIITANLPYLRPEQVKASPSIQKEPELALVAGNDGLLYYRRLFKQVKPLKNKNITILCEIDSSQTENISTLIKKILPDFSFQVNKDLRDLERLLVLRHSGISSTDAN